MEFENNNDIERDLNTEIDVDAEENETEVEDVDTDESDSDKEEEEKAVVEPKKQSQKQDKAFADMRRKLEASERKAKQLDELNAKTAHLFKDYGVKDLNEYFTKVEEQILDQKREKLRDAGYDEATVEEMVKTDAENLKLKQEVETFKKQQEDARLLSAYDEVAAEYPDLVKDPNDISPEVWAKFEQGYSLLDAYESVNRKMLRERDQAVAKQKTLNNLNSKKHLKSEGDGPGNASDTMIDPEVLQGYLDMGFNKKQAIAHYKKIYG